MFLFSAVSISFVGFTIGCFFISQCTIFILEGFVIWSEVGPAIVLSITHNFTLTFFLFRMVQCCYDTKQDGERVLSCVRRMLVNRNDVRASDKVNRHFLTIIQERDHVLTPKSH
uniref:Uncharacterized protein n=1 Tax=Cacopsylla melanoneura TaxID=428564 RepID=A0A8D8X9P0_9HEMI